MCGIAGIFNSNKPHEELNQIGLKMVNSIEHRGPDGNGILVEKQNNNRNILLAHTRLSIIDISKAGSQPMSTKDKKLWIVYNGEIYNYQEIKDQLVTKGIKFYSETDTEVVLEAYRYWGIDCFEKFIGMWALAIWNKKNNSMILSRDRLGIKPLYYYHNKNKVIFGSEPKAIIQGIQKSLHLNHQAVSDYFSYRYVLNGGSFFKEIKMLKPGNHKIFHGNGLVKTIKYWDLEIATEKSDFGENIIEEEIYNLMNSSVSYRMISDVPVGAFLSGGLDSSILVSEMSNLSSNQIKTFTTGFEQKEYNEFSFANEVANHCNTQHKEVILDVDTYLNSLKTILMIKDAPLAVPNELALHKLSLELSKDITVVLSGEGADELFGGYGRIFRSAYDYQRLAKYGKLIPKELKNNLLMKYKKLSWKNELDHFLNQYSYISFIEKEKLFNNSFKSLCNDDLHNRNYFNHYWSKLDGLDLHEKYMYIFQKIHLQGLLGRLDSATMSASVEGRVPFVDHRLIEYGNRLPLKYKLKWKSNDAMKKAKFLNSSQISENFDITKYILRKKYEKSLPNIISKRKKVGFPVPLGHWLKGPLKKYAKEILFDNDSMSRPLYNTKNLEKIVQTSDTSHKSGLKVWMMVNLEEWMRIYNIST